jgi:uncharacterized protein (UPF0218 family)
MKEIKYLIKYKTGEVIQVTDQRTDRDHRSDIRSRFERYLLTKRQGTFTFSFHDSEIESVDEHTDNVVLTVDFKDLCSIAEYHVK